MSYTLQAITSSQETVNAETTETASVPFYVIEDSTDDENITRAAFNELKKKHSLQERKMEKAANEKKKEAQKLQRELTALKKKNKVQQQKLESQLNKKNREKELKKKTTKPKRRRKTVPRRQRGRRIITAENPVNVGYILTENIYFCNT